MMDTIQNEGSDKLSCWFGLTYASFLTLPRVMMQDMPDEWQGKMSDLLNEFEDQFPNIELETRVQKTKNGKLVKWPRWILNYRRPNFKELEKAKQASTNEGI